MPLFSVIIPVYNRANLVGSALDSVLAQDFSDYELIVVDDGSTDQTAEVIGRYAAEHPGRIISLRQSNGGPGAARNTGIAAARGRYVAFLDSDDLWFPWALSCHAKAIQEFGSPSLISGDWTLFNSPGDLTIAQPPWIAELHTDLFSASGKTLPVGGTPSVAVEAGALRQAGCFPPQFINGEDQHLWLRLGCAPGFVQIKSPPIYSHRKHEARISANLDHMLAGARYVAAEERARAYPGGDRFLKIRLEVIAGMLRITSIMALEHRHHAQAWSLYRQSAAWHAKLRRWKYLLGFPLMALRSSVRLARTKR
jgi:Glycosyl transferase family 2